MSGLNGHIECPVKDNTTPKLFPVFTPWSINIRDSIRLRNRAILAVIVPNMMLHVHA